MQVDEGLHITCPACHRALTCPRAQGTNNAPAICVVMLCELEKRFAQLLREAVLSWKLAGGEQAH